MKYIKAVIKILTWMVTNGIPFVRGIIEEWKAAKAKKAARKGY